MNNVVLTPGMLISTYDDRLLRLVEYIGEGMWVVKEEETGRCVDGTITIQHIEKIMGA